MTSDARSGSVDCKLLVSWRGILSTSSEGNALLLQGEEHFASLLP